MTCLFRCFPLGLTLLFLSQGCFTARPTRAYDARLAPAPPDYADISNWAALPQRNDPADRTPCPDFPDRQAESAVDVFFLHPTTYTGSQRRERHWNAAADDAAVNQKTDSTTILYQASLFNSAGRIYAPRYRQAHLHAFYTRDTLSADAALDLAYADVKAAFQHYLEHWNQGRPFIIAGHSQGARHGMRLVRDLIENTPLESRLVAAYFVGWPVREGFFTRIKPCETPEETGCFCSWRTWERRYGLKHAYERDVICTNPVTWTIREGEYAPRTASRGAVLRNFCAPYPQLCDAEVYKGVLLCSKPKFPGSILFLRKNYHIGDLNLYYLDVRENARLRAAAYTGGR